MWTNCKNRFLVAVGSLARHEDNNYYKNSVMKNLGIGTYVRYSGEKVGDEQNTALGDAVIDCTFTYF